MSNQSHTTRYFKPRRDLSFSTSLLPQKIENGQQFKYNDGVHHKHWDYTGDSPSYDLLKANFIEVSTEAKAIEGY